MSALGGGGAVADMPARGRGPGVVPTYAHTDSLLDAQCTSYEYGRSLAILPTKSLLASARKNFGIKIWSLDTQKLTADLVGHTGEVHALAFHPAKGLLASCSADTTVKVWDIDTGKCLATFGQHGGSVTCVAFHPTKSLLASGDANGTIRIWNVDTFQEHHTSALKSTAGVYSLAFHPTKNLLAAGIASATPTSNFSLWNLDTKTSSALVGHTNTVLNLVFHPDQHFLISGSGDNSIRIWNVDTLKCTHTMNGHTTYIQSLALDPVDNLLFSGSHDKSVKIWDLDTFQWIATPCQAGVGHAGVVHGLVFNPANFSILSGSADGTLKIWKDRAREERSAAAAAEVERLRVKAAEEEAERLRVKAAEEEAERLRVKAAEEEAERKRSLLESLDRLDPKARAKVVARSIKAASRLLDELAPKSTPLSNIRFLGSIFGSENVPFDISFSVDGSFSARGHHPELGILALEGLIVPREQIVEYAIAVAFADWKTTKSQDGAATVHEGWLRLEVKNGADHLTGIVRVGPAEDAACQQVLLLHSSIVQESALMDVSREIAARAETAEGEAKRLQDLHAEAAADAERLRHELEVAKQKEARLKTEQEAAVVEARRLRNKEADEVSAASRESLKAKTESLWRCHHGYRNTVIAELAATLRTHVRPQVRGGFMSCIEGLEVSRRALADATEGVRRGGISDGNNVAAALAEAVAVRDEARERWFDAVDAAVEASSDANIERNEAIYVAEKFRAFAADIRRTASQCQGKTDAATEGTVASALEAYDFWLDQVNPAKLSSESDKLLKTVTSSCGADVLTAAHTALDQEANFWAAALSVPPPVAKLMAAADMAADRAEARVKALENLDAVNAEQAAASDIRVKLKAFPKGSGAVAKAIDAEAALNDALNDCLDAETAHTKAMRKKPRDEADCEKLRAEKPKLKALAQRCQRELERARVFLLRLTADVFPELKFDTRVAEHLAGCDAELESLVCPGRTLDMYSEEEWTAGTKPAGRSRHPVHRRSFGGTPCVLKEFDLSQLSHRSELRRQVLLLAKVNHPNVAPMRALFFNEDTTKAYLETFFYANGTLDRYLMRPDVTAPRLPAPHDAVLDRSKERCIVGALNCLQQLASGLNAVHSLKAVHGDVKLANALVDESGTVLLSDFDFARSSASVGASSLVGAGTFAFMPPEIEKGAGGPSEKGDMYSFGVCLVMVFVPSVQDAVGAFPSPSEQRKIILEAARALRAADEAAGALALECLDENPEKRPTTTDVLRHDIFKLSALRSAVEAREAKALEEEEQAKKNRRACCVCGDQFESQEGIECVTPQANGGKPHFACNDCFNGYVKSKVDPESMRVFGATGGIVGCPMYQCGALPFTAADTARHVSVATFEILTTARAKLAEQRISSTLARDFDQRLKQKEVEWQTLSESERRRRANRNHVVERILTLACPRCGQAFLDFNGCFALTCSRDNAAFCAYCLTDCGADAHRHVASCAYNTAHGKDVFASTAVFETAQRERRVRMLRTHLAQLNAEERKVLLEDCAMDLRDLNINTKAL